MAQPFQSSPMTAAVLGPDILARQLRLRQQQQYGQRMLQEGAQVPQGQMVSGHYVAPSWTQYLANGLKTYLGSKAINNMPQQMADLGRAQMQGIGRLFGVGSPSPQALAAGLHAQPSGTSNQGAQTFPVGPSGTSQAPQKALAVGAMQGSVGPTDQNAQRLGAILAGRSMMPDIPGMSRQQEILLASQVGIPEYLKLAVKQNSPTDVQKNLIAMGVQPGSPQWNQAVGSVVSKAGYIAPVSVRPGSTVLDPRTRQPIFGAPDNGMQVRYDAQGNAYTTAVPGWNQAVSANAQAKAAGAAAGKVIGERQGMGAIGAGKAADVKRYAPLVKQYETTVIPGESTVASVDRAIGYIDRLDKAAANGALDNVTGARGQYVPDFLMDQTSKDALEDLDSIKSKIVLNTMNEMRQASAAGATGFGNMQQNELKIIEDSLGSISRAQSVPQIRQNLAVIRDAFRAIANSAHAQIEAAQKLYKGIPGIPTQENLRGSGQEQTATKPSSLSGPNAIPGNYAGPVKNGIPAPTSAAQMKSLPSGTVFVAPDGTIWRAP